MVKSLLKGRKVSALITDPPFNVRKEAWDRYEENDAFLEFTIKWLSLGCEIANVIVCFMADKNVPLLRAAAEHVGIPYRRALIWRKPPGSQFAGASLDGFWFDFEIIQVFGIPQFKPSQNTKMAVLEHRTISNQFHGCEKPVELLEDLVNGYSQEGDDIVDFFLGTGTTLIACHKLRRICIGTELSPQYAAISLRRWEDLTGEKAVLLTNLSGQGSHVVNG